MAASAVVMTRFKSARVTAVDMTLSKENSSSRLKAFASPRTEDSSPPTAEKTPEFASTDQISQAPTTIAIPAAIATKKPTLVADQTSITLSLRRICFLASLGLLLRLNRLANIGSFFV